MLSTLSRVIEDPLLPGECFLYLAKSLSRNVIHSGSKVKGILRTHSFSIIQIAVTTKRVIKMIFWISLAIFSFPLTFSFSLFGCMIKISALGCGFSPQKRWLKVEELPLDEKNSLIGGQAAKKWKKLAKNKMQLTDDPLEKKIFEDSNSINKLIKQCLFKFKESSWLERLFVCRDVSLNKLQAIALTKDHHVRTRSGEDLGKHLMITRIATHPNNIRSKVNEKKYKRVEGAAAAIIFYLAQLCLKENLKGIYLESVDSAITFYKRLGFSRSKGREINALEFGTQPMILSLEKIKQ